MAARILVLDHTAQLAGGEIALSRLLGAIDRERFEVRVLLLEDGPLAHRLRSTGIRVAVLGAATRWGSVSRTTAAASPVALLRNAVGTLRVAFRLTAAIRGARADLVVANTLKSAVLASIAAPLTGRRWVWHLHDRIERDYLPAPLVSGLRLLARFAPRMVVANSLATRSTLHGVPDRRVVVAYPGLSVSEYPPAREHSKDATTTFGILGRIAPTKGQLEFLRAADELGALHPDVGFVVIGDALFNDAPFAEEVRKRAAEMGLGDRVKFVGWVDDTTSAIAGLTALVHASPVAEPFGQVIVEAMLAGVPVIATDAGGVREILDSEDVVEVIADGVVATRLGLLARPRDPHALATAMSWMILHPRERSEMAAAAVVSAVARFDIRITARAVEAVWSRASKSQRGPRLRPHRRT